MPPLKAGEICEVDPLTSGLRIVVAKLEANSRVQTGRNLA